MTMTTLGRIARHGARGSVFAAFLVVAGLAQQPPAPRPAGPAQLVPRPAVATPQDPAAAATPDFVGTVRDAGQHPVVGVTVRVVASGGLKPFELGTATTGADGSFRLTLQPGKLGGIAKVVKLVVQDGPLRLLESADQPLPRAADAAPLALVLPAAVGTEATRFSLSVAVRAADGSPVANARVVSYPERDGRPRLGGAGESQAVSDAAGVAIVGGRLPGTKWLFVDAREQGHAIHCGAVAIDGPGAHAITVALPRGGTLAGTVEALDGSSLRHVSVWLEDRDGLQYVAKLGDDGGVAFAGLGSAPHTLHLRGFPFSPVQRRGIMAGSEPFRIRLKPNDDPSDIGDHMGELHCRLIDAATDEAVAFDGFAVECHARRAGESSLATDAVAPPPPVQRAATGGRHEAFHETGLAAGRWVLVVQVEGYAATVHEVTLGENELIADLVIRLERGVELRGRLVDSGGAPVERATVFLAGVGALADANLGLIERQQLQRTDHDRWPSLTLCSTRTGADGTFVLSAVPPDVPLRVVAQKQGHRLAITAPNVYRAGAEVRGLELRLPQR